MGVASFGRKVLQRGGVFVGYEIDASLYEKAVKKCRTE